MKHARADYDRIQDPAGKIGEDEPVFLLRAQDKFFVEMLEHYRGCLLARRVYDMAHLVDEQIDRAHAWRGLHGTKLPDLPPSEEAEQ